MWDMKYSLLRYDSCIGETWLIHKRDVTAAPIYLHTYTHTHLLALGLRDMRVCMCIMRVNTLVRDSFVHM